MLVRTGLKVVTGRKPLCANLTAMSAEVCKAIRLDLRGLKCPLNWAHAKVRLDRMQQGELLEIILDDPRGYRDIPRAAESEGWAVTRAEAEGNTFKILIQK
jgi:tRNA 2-thiouridine synthesizing protein A